MSNLALTPVLAPHIRWCRTCGVMRLSIANTGDICDACLDDPKTAKPARELVCSRCHINAVNTLYGRCQGCNREYWKIITARRRAARREAR